MRINQFAEETKKPAFALWLVSTPINCELRSYQIDSKIVTQTYLTCPECGFRAELDIPLNY